MFPTHLRFIQTIGNSRQSRLYKATDGQKYYTIKIAKSVSASLREAFFDEYESMKTLSHPSLPVYYGITDTLILDQNDREPLLALCMDYMEGQPLSCFDTLTEHELFSLTLEIGKVLSYLLEHGVLYTDLHPDNILLNEGRVHLIDFTKCYHFRVNPNPLYAPKISYQLDESLPAMQLLIQELTLLLEHLFSLNKNAKKTNFYCTLLETGLHPHSSLSLEAFLSLFIK